MNCHTKDSVTSLEDRRYEHKKPVIDQPDGAPLRESIGDRTLKLRIQERLAKAKLDRCCGGEAPLRSKLFSTQVCVDERIPQMAEESPWTAATERGPRRSVKCLFVDILATTQTFTIIAVIDAFHSFGDRLEPRQIAFPPR